MSDQEITDQQIAVIFSRTDPLLSLDFMCHFGSSIKDDSNYWNFLGTAWKAGGSFAEQDRWVELFKSKRRNRQKMMKTSERREFAKLPKMVKAYRCCNDEFEQHQSICWSLDKKFVIDYAMKTDRSIIVESTFHKDSIFAYFNRRRESEILVWRGDMRTSY